MLNKILKIELIILLFLPLLAVAHFIVFPEETNCMLIEFADFKKAGDIYYRKEVPADVIQKLIQTNTDAEEKVNRFWNNQAHLKYRLIYAASGSDYKKYGRPGSPAVANIKMGAYVIIPKEMFDVNILSHEISHTVLYRRTGWFRLHFKIPAWFDEGLAMQVDDRDYYSIDTLLDKVKKGTILPDVSKMDTPGKFHQGSAATVMLNYSTAKYVVHQWLKNNSLNDFVRSINLGYSFENSYTKK